MLLAHEWLYGETVPTHYDHELRRHLELPQHFNPNSTHVELQRYAERIIFTDDVPSVLYQMNANKQLSIQGIMSSVKLPYDCFWMEYVTHVADVGTDARGDKLHYGVLVRTVGSSIDRAKVRMIVVCGAAPDPDRVYGLYERGVRFASSICYVLEFRQWPPIAYNNKGAAQYLFDVVWAFNRNKLSHSNIGGMIELSDAMHSLCWVVTELIFGIFLVTQPRVYQIEDKIPSAKLQKARARSGKKPLLEYKKITLSIGKTTKQHQVHRPAVGAAIDNAQDTDSDSAIQHRRYHKVMGHFRHYLNSDSPHTVWIEPHYRGDPKLGVTFTERDVMR